MTTPLLVREVIPASSEEIDLGTDSGRQWLDERYRRDGPFVRLNMITSLTGGAVGADGTSETLTNRVDRTILTAIRRAADAVVVGAQTVRAERLRRPRSGTLAVVSRSGILGGAVSGLTRTAERAGAVLLVCPESAVSHAKTDAVAMGAEIVTVPSSEGDPTPYAIIAVLAARGLARLVCEGGPGLASQFVAAGVIDELCITVAPVVGTPPVGGPFLRLPAGSAPHTTVAGMLADAAGFSYLRLVPSEPDLDLGPTR